jgi:hypothetical protein
VRKHSFDIYLSKVDGRSIPATPTISNQHNPKSLLTSPLTFVKDIDYSLCSPSIPSGSDMLKKIEQYFSGEDPSIFSWFDEKRDEVKALYDFEASPNSEEVSISLGDILKVLSVRDDGWTRVKLIRQGTEGYVPSTYIG